MTLLQFLNLILINLVALLAISYFWSFYTHKLFKPFAWLDAQKKGHLSKIISQHERKLKIRTGITVYGCNSNTSARTTFPAIWLSWVFIKAKQRNSFTTSYQTVTFFYSIALVDFPNKSFGRIAMERCVHKR